MDKMTSPKLVKDGEYIDALNLSVSTTETNTKGLGTNTPGTAKISTLNFNGVPLSTSAEALGSLEDSATSTVYWLIHDPSFPNSPTGKLDMIASYNESSKTVTQHLISLSDGGGVNTTLNFDPLYLMRGMNIIDNIFFFTDKHEAPRRFYTDKLYGTPSLPVGSAVDGFSREELMIIQKPPAKAPGVELLNLGNDSDFMSERFIAFAYRYRYANNEYSATSNWSNQAFSPSIFNIGIDSFLNEGMKNSANAARLTFNSGGSLVEGVDLLFKETGGDLIKVIEQIDKVEAGYINNSEYTYQFSGSKIFTILSEAEILRVSDSVPELAGAQTIIGGRLIYADYEEGNDLITADGSKVKVDYTVELLSESVSVANLTEAKSDAIIPWTGHNSVDSKLTIDFEDNALVEGGLIVIDLQLNHTAFSGDNPYPSTTSGISNMTFSFTLARNYDSVYDLVDSTEFKNRVGTIADATDINNACSRTSWTDIYVCSAPSVLDTLLKYATGVSLINTPIEVTSPSVGSSIMEIQLPAIAYVDDLGTPTQTVYEYLGMDFVNSQYQKLGDSSSLHSNRGYDIALFYEDEYKRRSSALTSTFNTVSVPVSESDSKNSIVVNIPKNHKAPAWAKRYGFAMKQDRDAYDTIYSSSFFRDETTNNMWFLLEGEQARKIEAGDVLIVKVDTSGPLNNLTEVSVLEKDSMASGFIADINGAYVPAGVYMRIKTGSFVTEKSPESTIAPEKVYSCETFSGSSTRESFPMNLKDPNSPGNYIDYSVPSGSVITFKINTGRRGPRKNGGGGCPRRDYHLTKKLISSANYENMHEWFVGDNIQALLDTGTKEVGNSGDQIYNIFRPAIATTPFYSSGDVDVNYYQFVRNVATNELRFHLTGTNSCGSNGGRKACTDMRFTINRALDTIVFETRPKDAIPDVFYYGSEVYDVDNNGFHLGDISNQTSTTPAIIKTDLYNCYSFGNGVESYKVSDSITGKTFPPGVQVTANNNKEFKRIKRTNDVTYSGVYNNESNVNKLNEFNAGLLNYKHLEDAFGPVVLIDGRENDLLVIHLNKVTYVLMGKNILSDATGESLLTSIPEVLGNQVARIEDMGISSFSSYAKFGAAKTWLDENRGLLLQLKGTYRGNETLSVISDIKMNNWFKSKSAESIGYQKIGGINPFSGEYLLTFTDKKTPMEIPVITCGATKTFSMSNGEVVSYDVNVGADVGLVNVDFFSEEYGPDSTIKATYDGVIYTGNSGSGPRTLQVGKNNPGIQIITVEITADDDELLIESTVKCPVADFISMKTIVLSDGGAQYNVENSMQWVLGSGGSAVVNRGVTIGGGMIGSDNISEYSNSSAQQGTGIIPPNGSSVNLIISTGDGNPAFPFNPSVNKFRFLRSNTLYGSTLAEMDALTLAALEITPLPTVGVGTQWTASTVMPTTGDYLYIVYDYRT